MLMCVFAICFAHETAGAARTRSSPRPLLRVACALFLFLRDDEFANLGRIVSREGGVISSRHARAGGHPVSGGVSGGIERSRRTGYSAFAEYDGGGLNSA